MPLIIETVGDLRLFLSRFPDDMPIVKNETFANCYTQIEIHKECVYHMAQTGAVITGDTVEVDLVFRHFTDAKDTAAGAFQAIVL